MGLGISVRLYRPGQRLQPLSLSELPLEAEETTLGSAHSGHRKSGFSGPESLFGCFPRPNGTRGRGAVGKPQKSFFHRPSTLGGVVADSGFRGH